MRYISTMFLVLASATTLLALPHPQVVNENAANDRANDGANAVENELKIQEALALSEAGCGMAPRD